jgi:hypothetical protein
MRSNIVKMLAPLNAIPVENPARPGTPDVNYVEGWIELKWLRSWPKRPETVILIDHYTTQQRLWAYKRRKAGGQSWFLLQCKREWILLDGAVAAFTVNRSTKAELISACVAYWGTGLNDRELIYYLKQRQPAYEFTPEEISRLREL